MPAEKGEKIFVNRTPLKVIPSLIIGCGGKGTEAVAHCRNLAEQELFGGDRKGLYDFNPLGFFALDSVKQDIMSEGEDHEIDTVPIAVGDTKVLERIIQDEGFPNSGTGPVAILRNMPRRDYARMINTLPNPSMGNATCPPLGAINFLGAWDRIRNRVKKKVEIWKRPYEGTFPGDDVFPFAKHNQIFIAASLYGGTGAGIHVHLAAMLRDILKDPDIEIPNTAIYGFFFLPDLVEKADLSGKMKLRANTYACLKELDHFLSGKPYVLPMGGQRELTIANRGTEYLFNRVFLINDRNLEGVEISEDDAVKMLGELIFHWSSTTLGADINARLIDDPRDRCQVMAPENVKKGGACERRICFYSTFGLATNRIPYEDLRHNLTVDFALEVMNELLLRPDEETGEERRKTEEQKEVLKKKFPASALLKRLGMDEATLSGPMDPREMPCFYRSKKDLSKKVEDFMEAVDARTLEDTLNIIKTEIRQKVFVHDDTQVSLEWTEELKGELDKMKDEIAHSGGFFEGPFTDLKAKVGDLKMKYEGLKSDARENAERELRSLADFLERHGEKRFFKGKRLAKFNQAFRRIKDHVERHMEYMAARRAVPRLEQVEKSLAVMIDSVKEDRKALRKIADTIAAMKRDYGDSRLLLNAVEWNLLENFIRNYPYPAGSRPEDLAEKVRKEGLKIFKKGEQKVEVKDFPDQGPQEVANGLFKLAEGEIARLGEEQWKRSFEESQLFKSAEKGSNQASERVGPKISAFKDVKESLNRHSAPYLEYQREEFVECRETFLIHPSLSRGTVDVEHRRWVKTEPWPEGRDIPAKGISPYALTSLQMHHGLPLYSINEFEDWKEAYDSILRGTDRPLHKFRTRVKDPWISVSRSTKLQQGEIAECLTWALERSDKEYPIFIRHKNVPILNMLEEDVVREAYFELFEEVFLDVALVKELLQEDELFAQYLLERIQVVYNANRNSIDTPIDKYIRCKEPADQADALVNLLDTLAQKGIEGDSFLKMKMEGGKTRVFVSREGAVADPRLYDTLTRHFLKELPTPVLKHGISEDNVKDMLRSSPFFQDAFLLKCREACEFLEMIGKSDHGWPMILKEK